MWQQLQILEGQVHGQETLANVSTFRSMNGRDICGIWILDVVVTPLSHWPCHWNNWFRYVVNCWNGVGTARPLG